MKKRITTLLLSLILTASAAACGDGAKTQDAKTDEKSGKDSGAAAEEITYDAEENVKLGDYSALKVSLPNTYKVTKEQVDDYAQSMAEYYAEPAYKETDKTTVEEGDTVNIDYEGKKDGVAFQGGTASGHNLTIGSHSFIDGFEEGLIGKKVGETVDLNLTFPEEYKRNEELAGAAVVFTVKINKIMEVDESKKFKLDDAFVKKTFDYDTVAEYKKHVKEYLQNSNESNKTADTNQAVLDELKKICEVTIPDGLLDARVDNAVEIFTKQNCSDGTSLGDYLNTRLNGMTEEDFRKEITTEMQNTLTEEMILEVIATKENVELDEDAFDEYVKQLMSANNYQTEEELYEANGTDAKSGEEYVRRKFLGRKALEKVVAGAKVKYGVTPDKD